MILLFGRLKYVKRFWNCLLKQISVFNCLIRRFSKNGFFILNMLLMHFMFFLFFIDVSLQKFIHTHKLLHILPFNTF